MSERTCTTCRWWCSDGLEANPDDVGECRKARPTPCATGQWMPVWMGKVRKMSWRASWPITYESDWCGEHQPREASDE